QSPEQPSKLRPGHETRFARKLELAFPEKPLEAGKQSSFYWMKIAAIFVVMITIGFFGYQSLTKTDQVVPLAETNSEVNAGSEALAENTPQIRLGDLSPDLKKVEDFYLTGINVQLASLEINDENKGIIDGYMEQLNELDTEYNVLNLELNEMGPTEATVSALIDNLKIRLELLFKLKNKLKELKNQKNEQITNLQA
ncbi:MAG: hypothetical protein HKM28_04365, partial [Flavobacteriaceae bacterium]|nr:hypothetical protein [Flavobacteriaceae bacterium]